VGSRICGSDCVRPEPPEVAMKNERFQWGEFLLGLALATLIWVAILVAHSDHRYRLERQAAGLPKETGYQSSVSDSTYIHVRHIEEMLQK
jgi:hypothetical protein